MPTTNEVIKYLLYPSSSRPQYKDRTVMILAGSAGAADRVVTFDQFEQLIDNAQVLLTEKGVRKQDKVLMTSPNCPELAATILACFRLGAVAVPVDFRLTAGEVANVAKGIEANVIVAASKRLGEICEQLDSTICKGGTIELSTISNPHDAASKLEKNLDETIDRKSPAFIILTSGTTGIPKGAVHDIGSLAANLIELAGLVDLNETMTDLMPLPLSHIFGFEVFEVCLVYGAATIFTSLEPTSFFVCLAKYKPVMLIGVPTIYGAMLNMDPKTVGLDNVTVMLCGGAPMPQTLADDFEKKFGKRLNNGYGSTESKILALNVDGPHTSVGKVVPSAKVEIVNDKDEVLPDGETGQVRVSGPFNMIGYLNNPEGTEKVLKGHSYYTGDLGRLEDGYLYISGRSKEMIIVAGNKVFPAEVEEALRRNSLVKEVAVYGLPHKQLGQIVKATIVLSDDKFTPQLEGSDEDIKAARAELITNMKEFCKQNLKRELRPMDYDFWPTSKSLPKTASGKVDKKQLVPA